jgi:hypothetical protein
VSALMVLHCLGKFLELQEFAGEGREVVAGFRW